MCGVDHSVNICQYTMRPKIPSRLHIFVEWFFDGNESQFLNLQSQFNRGSGVAFLNLFTGHGCNLNSDRVEMLVDSFNKSSAWIWIHTWSTYCSVTHPQPNLEMLAGSFHNNSPPSDKLIWPVSAILSMILWYMLGLFQKSHIFR